MSDIAKIARIERDRTDLVGTLIREEPFPIYLFENNKFGARKGEEWILTGTIKTLEKKMASERKASEPHRTNRIMNHERAYPKEKS